MSISRVLLLTAAGLLSPIGGAAGQACVGLPTRDGAIALAGSYTTLEGRDEVGGEFNADVSGPGAFGLAYRTGLEDGPSTYEVRGAYDLYLLEPALCVVAGVRYTDVESGAVSERLGVPLGFGVGKTLGAARVSATVYAIPQYVWLREVRRDALGAEEVDTSNAFAGEAGVTLGFLPLFANAAVTLDTVNDEPGLRIRLGLIF